MDTIQQMHDAMKLKEENDRNIFNNRRETSKNAIIKSHRDDFD